MVGRQLEPQVPFLGAPLDVSRRVEQILFDERSADGETRALKNVYAIAPPISSASTRGIRFSMTSSLSDTLAPPSTATNGRSGFLMALVRYSTSRAISSPAAACLT